MCATAEVDVDVETGIVQVLKLVLVSDILNLGALAYRIPTVQDTPQELRDARRRRSSRRQRILPVQPWKSGEVAVARTQYQPVFDRERRQVRVRDQA